MCSCRFAWQAWHFVTFHACEVQDCREAKVAVPIGKSGKNVSFSCQKMCSCRFAWQAWHFVTFHVCEVRDLVMLKLACLWEKSHKRVFFDVFEDVLMSFCVAGLALCDIPCV